MQPEPDELDEEIRGHLALEVKSRVDEGEEPEAARLAALRQFGNVLLTRDSMREVWRPRWLSSLEALGQDLRVAGRSLLRAKGLAITVAVTLALGIGANAAMFSVVREVLLRPLVNRDADRLVYVRQGAPGLGADNILFSMPEIRDLRSRVTTLHSFGDFSTIDFTLVGMGEPRMVKAGVVSGSYFEVMGLRPALGRLLNETDDGKDATPAVVLTHRFWTTSLDRDPGVIGKTIRLGSRSATVVGVLEPSLPYPADTELIANVVTSPHHLGATMVDERTHRMTELFGRLAPGATLEDVRAELRTVHAAIVKENPEAYSREADVRLTARLLQDQLAAPARPVLLLLLAAAALMFVIACANVASLVLARAVRREGELGIRAALGASAFALRRTLLAESLLLCGLGALLGVLLARPLVAVVSRFAARFSVSALGATVDATLLFVGVGLALAAAVALAFVPRLPAVHGAKDGALAGNGLRLTPGTNRRLRAFAVTQIALTFVLLAGAGMLLSALVALQSARTGYNMRQVLAIDVPVPIEAATAKVLDTFQETARRVGALPGVEGVAMSNFVPWRDVTTLMPTFPFTAEGYAPAFGEENPRARLRNVTSGFFAALGVPFLAGRDFDDEDKRGNEPVVIVSQSVAQRLFPGGEAVNRRLWWTDPLFGSKPLPRRIVGVVADVDDENVVPRPTLTIYHSFRQLPYGGRLFVHVSGDPYALVTPIKRVIREISPEQPVERAATLADVRLEVLAPERLNAFVFSGFAGVALLIAVVGVAGVLAFSVSARTHEFGVRLAIGLAPRQLLADVLREGAWIAAVGIAIGAVVGYALGLSAAHFVEEIRLPGPLAVLAAGAVLMTAAVVASIVPAARASRVDVTQALRSE